MPMRASGKSDTSIAAPSFRTGGGRVCYGPDPAGALGPQRSSHINLGIPKLTKAASCVGLRHGWQTQIAGMTGGVTFRYACIGPELQTCGSQNDVDNLSANVIPDKRRSVEPSLLSSTHQERHLVGSPGAAPVWPKFGVSGAGHVSPGQSFLRLRTRTMLLSLVGVTSELFWLKDHCTHQQRRGSRTSSAGVQPRRTGRSTRRHRENLMVPLVREKCKL